MKQLVIDRTQWCRGDGVHSKLLTHIGERRCCLGFLAMTCGASREEILGRGSPQSIPTVKWPKRVIDSHGENTPWTDRAIEINDCEESTFQNGPAQRERELIKHFRQIGYKLTFIN